MPTKPIGPGTCNLSVNVRKPVRSALGRAAFRLDISMGEFCRRLFTAGVQFAMLIRFAGRAREADCRARAWLRAAQDPRSPGGVNITPAEAAKIDDAIAQSEREDARIVTVNFQRGEVVS